MPATTIRPSTVAAFMLKPASGTLARWSQLSLLGL